MREALAAAARPEASAATARLVSLLAAQASIGTR